ncbi:MAG: hypothetical protein ACPGJF_15180 [Sinimarinibacterium flocculans]|uniref:hypothetical protein n=1 Tax=Sinimarinibacterium flocculans TaxID=985250 RepID=UPI003C3FE210
MNILATSILILSAVSAPTAVALPAIDHGMALGDVWDASAAEYQASAELYLEQLGARNVQAADPVGSIMAGFLQMFAGGGGAPQDLVKPRPEGFGAQ